MRSITLTPHDVENIDRLLTDLAKRCSRIDDPMFLKHATVFAHDLPRHLRLALHEFKLLEDGEGTCLISGLPVDDERIGPTPPHWRYRPEHSPALREEMFFFLCSTLLGEAIAWATQQDGYLIHEVVPIKEYETEQIGFSSQRYLEWHTEDAFHPYRPDYLGLLCLRNPTETSTVISSVTCLKLSASGRQLLFEPHFTIRPDDSHLEKNRAVDRKSLEEIFKDIEQIDYTSINRMSEVPDKIAVMFGDPAAPYLRVDPYFMNPVADEAAAGALRELVEQLEENLKEYILRPGQILFIDNYRAVHGRPPFRANYDGRDRWLKRLNLARDLRKSRDARASAHCRKIR